MYHITISITLTEQEKAIAESYAKKHSLPVEEMFKEALFEKIEDEYDTAVGIKAYNEYLQSGNKSQPIEELRKNLIYEK